MHITLAIEGGGTRSKAGLYDETGKLIRSVEGGPANPVAYGYEAVAATVGGLLTALDAPGPVRVFAALAGAFDAPIRGQVANALAKLSEVEEALVTTDVHPVLFANTRKAPGILVVAGTGSNVLACAPDGPVHQVGGRGALLGDGGSSYGIACRALRCAAESVDGLLPPTILLDVLPKAAGLEDIERFVRWGMTAEKSDIAALAQAVLMAADDGDAVAARIVATEAESLVVQVRRAHELLGTGEGVPVYAIGGLLEHETRFGNLFAAGLQETAGLRVQPPPVSGHAAVYQLSSLPSTPVWAARAEVSHAAAHDVLPATEGMDTAHPPLDALSAAEIVDVMNRADTATVTAVGKQSDNIARVIDLAAGALQAGGRILYTGAGTSGRLGVLDASECPPTFGVPAERVVGIIAGGESALRHSVEGAEDDRDQADRDLDALQIAPEDLLVGIAASGTTPYVHASIAYAKAKRARTALLCCNPAAQTDADILIALDTGAEVLPGSTRLKAGTATKMVLNMITTGAMARSGYVVDGLMAGMTPRNAKLRERAARIVARLAGVDAAVARAALESVSWHIGQAVLAARDGLSPTDAAAAFDAAEGNLRRALRGG